MPTLSASEAKGRQNQKDNTGGHVISSKHDLPVGRAFDLLAFGDYGDGDTASTMKARDYKDATDLVVQGKAIKGNK